jgi:hypothetical protein
MGAHGITGTPSQITKTGSGWLRMQCSLRMAMVALGRSLMIFRSFSKAELLDDHGSTFPGLVDSGLIFSLLLSIA